MAAKTFKADLADNPTMQFISDPRQAEAAETAQEALGQAPIKAPKGYKVDPRFIETKSKRVQLMVQPSIVAKLQAQAKRERISFNELCNRLFRAACED